MQTYQEEKHFVNALKQKKFKQDRHTIQFELIICKNRYSMWAVGFPLDI